MYQLFGNEEERRHQSMGSSSQTRPLPSDDCTRQARPNYPAVNRVTCWIPFAPGAVDLPRCPPDMRTGLEHLNELSSDSD